MNFTHRRKCVVSFTSLLIYPRVKFYVTHRTHTYSGFWDCLEVMDNELSYKREWSMWNVWHGWRRWKIRRCCLMENVKYREMGLRRGRRIRLELDLREKVYNLLLTSVKVDNIWSAKWVSLFQAIPCKLKLVKCEVREKTKKMQQLDVYYQYFLNMFRASLCPSSGEQDVCYYTWCAAWNC